MARLFQIIIKIYSFLISPFLGKNCRFQPTCSCYMHEALERHGAFKGLYLGVCRILSCHALSRRDFFDPVPKRFAWRDVLGYKGDAQKSESGKNI